MGCFARRVCWMFWLIPLGGFGVDVHEEPFVILVVPHGFPAFRNLWWRWALRILLAPWCVATGL
jgi:hypothetical protein